MTTVIVGQIAFRDHDWSAQTDPRRDHRSADRIRRRLRAALALDRLVFVFALSIIVNSAVSSNLVAVVDRSRTGADVRGHGGRHLRPHAVAGPAVADQPGVAPHPVTASVQLRAADRRAARADGPRPGGDVDRRDGVRGRHGIDDAGAAVSGAARIWPGARRLRERCHRARAATCARRRPGRRRGDGRRGRYNVVFALLAGLLAAASFLTARGTSATR